MSLGTDSDGEVGADTHSFLSSSSSRSRNYADLLEAERRVSEQAIATAVAERGRADQAVARAEFAERILAMTVQGSQSILQPRPQ